jgi:hypothetical protein
MQPMGRGWYLFGSGAHACRGLGVRLFAAMLLVATVASLAAAASAGAAEPLPLTEDLKRRPPVIDPATGKLLALPNERETAAFAAGRVAVGVIFVESDGTLATDREDWANRDPEHPGDRRTNVLDRIGRALDWWEARSQGALEFVLPTPGQAGAPQTAITGYEPIAMPTGAFNWVWYLSDAAWRWQIMGGLGFAHDPVDDWPLPEQAYSDWLRRETGADWAVVLYVVDSLNDKDGLFSDGIVAYTWSLYGPYMVLTYDNDGYGFGRFDMVLAHELGHVFGALDEYRPPFPGYPSTGELRSGYLGALNGNALKGGSTDLPCIMRGGREAIAAYGARELCPSTRRQAGWRDTDKDGIVDVLDTRPLFTDAAQEQRTDGVVAFAGTVRERPWPRGTSTPGIGPVLKNDLSIFVPSAVRYRIDEGPWRALEAADGGWDEAVEAFDLTAGPLSPGPHLVRVEATTGVRAAFERYVWAGPVQTQLVAAVAGRAEGTITFGDSAKLSVRSLGAAATPAPIPRLAGVHVYRGTTRIDTVSTDRTGGWSRTVSPGRNASYSAAYAGGAQFLGAESPETRLWVRALLTARRDTARPRVGAPVVVSGRVRPANPGAQLSLQSRRVTAVGDTVWTTVATARARADSTYRLVWRPAASGSVSLRVRFEGSATNRPAVAGLGRFAVR